MKYKNPFFFCLLLFIFLFSLNPLQAEGTLKGKKVGPQADGSILVPTNQFLRPAGFQVYLPGRPVDLAITPDEEYLLVQNRISLDLVRIEDRTVMQALPLPDDGSSFTGILLSADGSRVYMPDASKNIQIAEISPDRILRWLDPIELPGPSIGGNPVPGGLALNSTESKILVTLSRNNSLAIVDQISRAVTEIPVGIAPYDLLLISDEKAYVSNWGGRRPEKGESTFNSSGSQVLVDPDTGVANNGSVSVVNLKTGIVEKEIEVGLHPSGMAASPDHLLLYVACANSDTISVIDTATDAVTEEISVHVHQDTLFGSAPNALTISPDGKTLYCANGTDNAVAVIETAPVSRVSGFIPTGWCPGSVISNKAGDFLYAANIKGIGSRNQRTDRAGYNSRDYLGSISIIPVPSREALEQMTETVHRNNSYAQKLKSPAVPAREDQKTVIPVLPGQSSVFKHVVYIIKENRTYDQVFGDMPMGDGDPDLVLFGRDVTPNHHALVEQFVLMDNYYCSGILSADGHQWTDEAYVTDYIEKFFGGFSRSYPYDGDDALAYASSGFIWDNVLRHGLTFRDYGEFVNPVIEPEESTFSEIYADFISGDNKIKIRAKANLEQLEPYICPTFIGFPNRVTDAYRAEEFLKELKQFEKENNFPNFIIMLLPNDHTSGTKPGMPTPRAAVADNDLALGKVVEAISHSKFWKETCIFVTEDDPQDGLDHVDGHRTVGMVISPYTKRQEVVSTYYSQINMVRTMENILGIPPMNQLDLAAEPMTKCFSVKADLTPYKALSASIPLDELNPPLQSLKGDQLYWAQKSMEQNLEELDKIEEDVFNRIIWHAVKGYDCPYPELGKK